MIDIDIDLKIGLLIVESLYYSIIVLYYFELRRRGKGRERERKLRGQGSDLLI